MSNWIQLDPTRENWLLPIIGSYERESENGIITPDPSRSITNSDIGVGKSASLLWSQGICRRPVATSLSTLQTQNAHSIYEHITN